MRTLIKGRFSSLKRNERKRKNISHRHTSHGAVEWLSVGFKKLTFSHWGKAKWPINENKNNTQHRLNGPVIVIAVMFLSRNKFFHQHLGLNSLLHSEIVAFQNVYLLKSFFSKIIRFQLFWWEMEKFPDSLWWLNTASIVP